MEWNRQGGREGRKMKGGERKDVDGKEELQRRGRGYGGMDGKGDEVGRKRVLKGDRGE